MIDMMDKHGIDKIVTFAIGNIRTSNSEHNSIIVEEVKKYPDRIIPFIRLNPYFGEEAVKELEHGVSRGEALCSSRPGVELDSVGHDANPVVGRQRLVAEEDWHEAARDAKGPHPAKSEVVHHGDQAISDEDSDHDPTHRDDGRSTRSCRRRREDKSTHAPTPTQTADRSRRSQTPSARVSDPPAGPIR